MKLSNFRIYKAILDTRAFRSFTGGQILSVLLRPIVSLYLKWLCRGCGKKFSEYEILLVKSKDNPLETVCYCPDCCVTHVNWCLECNEGFEVDESLNDQDEYAICPECQALKKINVTGNKNNGFNAD